MLTFATNFWPLFWATLGVGAVLTVLVTLGVANVWSRRTSPVTVQDATLTQLAAAYQMADREHANAA
jgi:hypothetical protein